MTELAATSLAIGQRRTWIAPAVLIAVHTFFDLVTDPFQEPIFHCAAMLMAGVWYVQPVLFGAWAALGPTPAIRRIPLSLAVYATILLLAAALHKSLHGDLSNASMLLLFPALAVGTMSVLLTVKKITRWQIVDQSIAANAAANASQFSLRFLLGFTTLCAVLLAAGRGLATVSQFGVDAIPIFLYMTGIILLLMFPAMIVPLAALSARLSIRVLIAIPLLWAVLSFLAIGAYMQMDGAIVWETARYIMFVQLGAVIAGLLTALFLRFNGYRLIRNTKISRSANPGP